MGQHWQEFNEQSNKIIKVFGNDGYISMIGNTLSEATYITPMITDGVKDILKGASASEFQADMLVDFVTSTVINETSFAANKYAGEKVGPVPGLAVGFGTAMGLSTAIDGPSINGKSPKQYLKDMVKKEIFEMMK